MDVDRPMILTIDHAGTSHDGFAAWVRVSDPHASRTAAVQALNAYLSARGIDYDYDVNPATGNVFSNGAVCGFWSILPAAVFTVRGVDSDGDTIEVQQPGISALHAVAAVTAGYGRVLGEGEVFTAVSVRGGPSWADDAAVAQVARLDVAEPPSDGFGVSPLAGKDRNGRLIFVGTVVTDGRAVGPVVAHDEGTVVWSPTLSGSVVSPRGEVWRIPLADV